MNTFFLDRLNSEPHALAFAGQSTPWPVALADQSANPALDEALHTHAAAAQALLDYFDSYSLVISFDLSGCLDTYPLVTEDTRRYLFSDDGGAVAASAAAYAADLASAETQLVFCTDSRDTRFEAYGLLRPLLELQTES